jgi:hypothetical protein
MKKIHARMIKAPKLDPVENKIEFSKHLKFPCKLNGSSTSVTVKKDIICIWFIFSEYRKMDVSEIYPLVQEIVNECAEEWIFSSGKGFSDFVTDKIIYKTLNNADFSTYKRVRLNLDIERHGR